MITGHASHQVGLDADIWLTPMPAREFTPRRARRNVGDHGGRGRPARPGSIPRCGRRVTSRSSRRRLRTRWCSGYSSTPPSRRHCAARPAAAIAPGWRKCGRGGGHDYHFHVRLRCPGDSPECKSQPPAGGGDGCGKDPSIIGSPTPCCTPSRRRCREAPKPGKPMSSLPPACRAVLAAP